MKMYTVIGFWRNTQQRFMESIKAKDADEAERNIGGNNPGITIVGSVLGDHVAADRETYIQEFGE